ncbi:hypothetical protein BWI93_05225 [Siphonobacter sp. BAB-5385]|uniref:hypothetical protein n=1 Tax=Siphonobacter sp. BAB-5385 TaxID=1864822 RepID=UPI000B9EBB20|nr:hypothetical protein [Siphonobacter sp. BAB-5385]OZI09208.1 hypothetical protein BWI93_05225 [Siphonobacter sp. BAB-5385]
MNTVPTMQEVAEHVHADHYKGTINGIILAGVIPEYGGQPSIWMNTKADTEWLKWVGVLANAAREVNGEWEPNWEDTTQTKYYFHYSQNNIRWCWTHHSTAGAIVFKSLEHANAAREMLNEWSKQQGLEEDGILLRALGVVKGGRK